MYKKRIHYSISVSTARAGLRMLASVLLVKLLKKCKNNDDKYSKNKHKIVNMLFMVIAKWQK